MLSGSIFSSALLWDVGMLSPSMLNFHGAFRSLPGRLKYLTSQAYMLPLIGLNTFFPVNVTSFVGCNICLWNINSLFLNWWKNCPASRLPAFSLSNPQKRNLNLQHSRLLVLCGPYCRITNRCQKHNGFKKSIDRWDCCCYNLLYVCI